MVVDARVPDAALAALKAALRAARKFGPVKGRTPKFSFKKDGTVTFYIAIEVLPPEAKRKTHDR